MTKRTTMVRNRDVAAVALLDAKIAALQDTIRAAESNRENLASAILTLLQNGATVEPGPFQAALVTSERKNIAWRREFEARLGKDTAIKVVSETTPTVTIGLVVSGPTPAVTVTIEGES